mmetsp:Transcript_52118/g.86419  ORF Transcript_52118/g.86419 Transcript_52118/m.86419 type:complete len:439 (+) Transcript_52118:40-1356(+)|eukprot:CAMPEP_0119316816 /NCGR_PEP_ID=MMETSP1333-20130426/41010_1 /TAXON_ID=418940 /ORGANISM="Scyphosphaera apsteinii, Strain RCC1455" /LENGTH=438 /DNA_ID=CAMNT_0007322573 /DNA_START=36 /DNA_END=1352 /DNA_ORIENTATION=+
MPEVHYTNFCQKLCNSFVGVIIGILLVPLGIYFIFVNEGNEVCTVAAYDDFQAAVVDASCQYSPTLNGKPVKISCPVITQTQIVVDGGTGIQINTAMQLTVSVKVFQWKEIKYSESRKDTVGGGTTTVSCYCFQTEWSYVSTQLNPQHLNPQVICGIRADDPGPAGGCLGSIPNNNNIFFSGITSVTGVGRFESVAPNVGLGTSAFSSVQFHMDETQVAKIVGLKPLPLEVPLSQALVNQGFVKTGPAVFSTVYANQPRIGDRQLEFHALTTDVITALGKQIPQDNGVSGIIKPYISGGLIFPPCDTRSTVTFRATMISTDELFGALHSELATMTVTFRICLFLLLFLAFYLIGNPLSVAPDIIPCIGPFFSGIAACFVGIMAFFLALSFWITATALSWLFYRPLLGLLLLLGAAATFAAALYARGQGKSQEIRGEQL